MSANLNESAVSRALKATVVFDALMCRDPNGEIWPTVRNMIQEVAPVLGQVSRTFPEYTLHDPEHSARVLANMGKILPPNMLDALSAVELSILIYAAYLHDIGMAAPPGELAS